MDRYRCTCHYPIGMPSYGRAALVCERCDLVVITELELEDSCGRLKWNPVINKSRDVAVTRIDYDLAKTLWSGAGAWLESMEEESR